MSGSPSQTPRHTSVPGAPSAIGSSFFSEGTQFLQEGTEREINGVYLKALLPGKQLSPPSCLSEQRGQPPNSASPKTGWSGQGRRSEAKHHQTISGCGGWGSLSTSLPSLSACAGRDRGTEHSTESGACSHDPQMVRSRYHLWAPGLIHCCVPTLAHRRQHAQLRQGRGGTCPGQPVRPMCCAPSSILP